MSTRRPPHHDTPQGPLMYTTVDGLLGRILVARSPRGVCAVLPGERDPDLVADLRARFPHSTLTAVAADESTAAIVAAMQPGGRDAVIALDFGGTAFQQVVWRAILTVPRGTTATYREVAAMSARPGAIRAVASACAANPLAGVVPCHRVVRSDGRPGGYRWGLERKAHLLAVESCATPLRGAARG